MRIDLKDRHRALIPIGEEKYSCELEDKELVRGGHVHDAEFIVIVSTDGALLEGLGHLQLLLELGVQQRTVYLLLAVGASHRL